MEIYKVNDIFIPKTYSTSVKDGVLSYFIYGAGYKKTKKFQVIQASDIPDNNHAITWLKICRIQAEWGEIVAMEFAQHKTAGIVANMYLKAYYSFYTKGKRILDNMSNADICFELLIPDYMLAIVGMYSLDIVKMDDYFSQHDQSYNSNRATYLGKPCSFSEYIEKRYGNDYRELIDTLLAS